MKLHRYVDHQRLHIVTKDVISLSISVLLLFRHYISHKITFGAPSSGGVLRSACSAFIRIIMSRAYLILLKVGIPNLVCGCHFGSYHFRVTLTSDLVCRISLKLFEMGIPNMVCGCILALWSTVYHLRVTVTLNLTFDLVF